MKKRRCSMSYWIYYENKRIKSIDCIEDKETGTIVLIQKHYLLYKFWFLLIIFSIIINIIGSCYTEVNNELIIIEIKYKEIDRDNFFVNVNKRKEQINVFGVGEYEVVSLKYDVPLLVEARQQKEKKIFVFTVITLLGLITLSIILYVLFRK